MLISDGFGAVLVFWDAAKPKSHFQATVAGGGIAISEGGAGGVYSDRTLRGKL